MKKEMREQQLEGLYLDGYKMAIHAMEVAIKKTPEISAEEMIQFVTSIIEE